jgi:hypothetical protein
LKNSCDYKVVKKPEVKKHHNKKHHRHHHKKSHKKKSAKKNHEKKHEAKSELTPDLAGAPVKADILKSQNSPVANPNHKDSSNKKTTKDKKQSEKKADQKAAAKSHDSESVEAAKSMNTQSDSGKYNAAQEIIDAGKNSDDEVVEMNFADVNSAASSDKAARK